MSAFAAGSDLHACAQIVQRGDPDRFLAVMSAPVAARRVLFPIYAFNLEVARAPWVTQEPMIAEMRLQWWRDALEEIGQGGPVRKHEVTTPLADVLDAEGAAVLDRLVQARRWDIYTDPFEDAQHFAEYLSATGGGLMWAAVRALGGAWESPDPEIGADTAPRLFGAATALVRFLQAVPELEARGRVPLVDGRPGALAALARDALSEIPPEMVLRRCLEPQARPALLEGWQTHPLLKQIARAPGRVAEGRVGLSPFRKRLRLLRWS